MPSSPPPPPPVAVSAPVAPARNPRSIGLPNAPTPIVNRGPGRGSTIGLASNNTAHDDLVAKAIADDPGLQAHAMRIKPRFATLCGCCDDDVLDWGERNVKALRSVTESNAKLAARINQMKCTEWIDRTSEAANSDRGLLTKLFRNAENPQYYQTRLTGVRDELVAALKDLKVLYEEVKPDAEDLRMDIASLQTYHNHNPGRFDDVIVHGRLRTLIAAQQTVVMAMQAIEQSRTVCTTNVQTIDRLLQVTIPNWQLALNQPR